ncbi:MBL fold metallo-hydrolase [Bacillus sp. FSL K6-6483]|uniref:MBL fold metallo-hydrolase n=1 Tax=Shouchella rhizosphaerae TaxID=866786 RepID=UPI0012905B52
MFTFIGCGSAFHTKLGNNGIMAKESGQLFLIDCGSSTFHRLQSFHVLDGVKTIHVAMTHTHPDHIGSLGDLIFYSYFKMEPAFQAKVTVLAPKALLPAIKAVLKGNGVDDTHVFWQEIKDAYMYEGCGGIELVPVQVQHAENLLCFGYEINTKGNHIYYSGDANAISADVLQKLKAGQYDVFYQDTCTADYPGNVHLSLRKLIELVPEENRSVVCCMHVDEEFDLAYAKKQGFQTATDYLIS